MSRRSIDEPCRNCGQALFQKVVSEDGNVELADPNLWPETDGIMKYFRCPACQGKNLVAIIEEPGKPRIYEILGFMRR